MKNLNVKNGQNCLNKNEVLFRVNLIKTGENKFAIMLSISHLLADGFTFYSIFKMLS